MIKINKSASVPAILAGKGKAKIKALSEAFDLSPAAYSKAYHKTKNPFKFEFDGDIYGPKEVKDQLKDEQFNKCCFCENKDFDDIAHGDVEHFRPKSAYSKDASAKALLRPGYYWVAYEWENLFYSCQICNQSFKKNFFPLTDETKRAKSHKDQLEPLSVTLLIDPAKEDPDKHIGFRKEIPFHKTDKGEYSIKYFGIDRDKLSEKRRKHLEEVRKNILLAKIDMSILTADLKKAVKEDLGATSDQDLADIIDTAKKYIASAARQDAAFASMIRNNFITLPR
jgi:uncharacterized protein (TIGR02646 family)